MAKTRDNYRVTGGTVQEVINSLNFLFQRLADRMDKIEGIRGTASIESDLEMNSNRVREVGAGSSSDDAARTGDLLTEPLTLSGLTVTGDTVLSAVSTGDVSVDGNVQVLDANGTVIHSLE